MVKGGAASSISPRFQPPSRLRSTANNVVHLENYVLVPRNVVHLIHHVKVVHLGYHVDVVHLTQKVCHLVHERWSSRKTLVLQ